MLRLLQFFWGKNSSPIFSTLVRARASSPCILLVGTIKPYNLYYQHFLLRPFLSEIFAGPFHRAKMIEQGKTVHVCLQKQEPLYRFNMRNAIILESPAIQISENPVAVKNNNCQKKNWFCHLQMPFTQDIVKKSTLHRLQIG